MFSFQNASYGKKNGVWYAGQGVAVGAGAGPAWVKPLSRKASLVENEAPPPGGGGGGGMPPHKPSSGRVIRIINQLDHTVQVSSKKTLTYSTTFPASTPPLPQPS